MWIKIIDYIQEIRLNFFILKQMKIIQQEKKKIINLELLNNNNLAREDNLCVKGVHSYISCQMDKSNNMLHQIILSNE